MNIKFREHPYFTSQFTLHIPASGWGEDGSSSLNTTGCLSHEVPRNSLRDESALEWMRKPAIRLQFVGVGISDFNSRLISQLNTYSRLCCLWRLYCNFQLNQFLAFASHETPKDMIYSKPTSFTVFFKFCSSFIQQRLMTFPYILLYPQIAKVNLGG